MSDKAYSYVGVFTLDDGTEEVIDLEERGWAEPTRLARVVRFALTPRVGPTMFPSGFTKWTMEIPLPVVVINIPEGAKPVFKTRAFGKINSGTNGDTTNTVLFRCYGIGFKMDSYEYLMWVLPSGAIEVGPDPNLADLFLKNSTQ